MAALERLAGALDLALVDVQRDRLVGVARRPNGMNPDDGPGSSASTWTFGNSFRQPLRSSEPAGYSGVSDSTSGGFVSTK